MTIKENNSVIDRVLSALATRDIYEADIILVQNYDEETVHVYKNKFADVTDKHREKMYRIGEIIADAIASKEEPVVYMIKRDNTAERLI